MLFTVFYGNLNSSRPKSNTYCAFEDQLLILCSLSQLLKFTDGFSEQSVMRRRALFIVQEEAIVFLDCLQKCTDFCFDCCSTLLC